MTETMGAKNSQQLQSSFQGFCHQLLADVQTLPIFLKTILHHTLSRSPQLPLPPPLFLLLTRM